MMLLLEIIGAFWPIIFFIPSANSEVNRETARVKRMGWDKRL